MARYSLKIIDYSNPLAVRFKNISDLKDLDLYSTETVDLFEGETVISNVTNADQRYFPVPGKKIALPLNNVIIEKNNIKLKDPREMDTHIIYGKIISDDSKITFEGSGQVTALGGGIASEVLKLTHEEDGVPLSSEDIRKLEGIMIAIEGERIPLFPGNTLYFVDLKDFGSSHRYSITLLEKTDDDITTTERSEK